MNDQIAKYDRKYKGYHIVNQFPGQWEVEIWEEEPRPTIHLFPSLKTAKAWIDGGCSTGEWIDNIRE